MKSMTKEEWRRYRREHFDEYCLLWLLIILFSPFLASNWIKNKMIKKHNFKIYFYTWSSGAEGAWTEENFRSKHLAKRRIKKVFGKTHSFKTEDSEKDIKGEWFEADALRSGYITCQACIQKCCEKNE